MARYSHISCLGTVFKLSRKHFWGIQFCLFFDDAMTILIVKIISQNGYPFSPRTQYCCKQLKIHLLLDKMVANSRCIFGNEKKCILFKFHWSLLPMGNDHALAEIMAWCRIGDRSLSEPILTRFTNEYMWYYGGNDLTCRCSDASIRRYSDH